MPNSPVQDLRSQARYTRWVRERRHEHASAAPVVQYASVSALVAQRIEHLTTDQKVGGSSPSERARSEALPDPGGAFLLTLLLTAGPDAARARAKMPAASASCSLTTPLREETAVLHTLPRPCPGLQTLPGTGPALLSMPAGGPEPDPAVFADAVARYRVLERLRGFRQLLYECLTARADALFELADAVLCADHAVTSLVQLCLEPEFTRGHGALYDALSAGRIDDERLFSLLAAELPQALAWIAEHDVIDHGLLEQALAGLPAGDAWQVRDACARWGRLRFAVDATAYPRPDAWCSPGREHVHHGACHCRGSSKTVPGWEYQFTAAIGHLRTAWAALTDVARTTPADRTARTIAQVRNVLRRLRAAGHGRKAAPLFIFDAGYSAAALTDGLAGCPAHILVRPTSWSGSPPGRCFTPSP
jgi:hypothetical protein